MKIEIMKNLITLVILVTFSLASWAQHGHAEKIKAFKAGYLTQELDLTPEEAQKFWPVYNEFEQKMHELRFERRKKERDRINALGGPEELSDKQAREILNGLLESEEKALSVKKELYQALNDILSPVKLVELYRAENDFNRRMLSEYRRRGPRNNPQE